ncbi:MAG: ABC transporter permease, partial [Rhodomicrobium sp.]|nr:ABC transporter permease [Rhodomicrobium sp.]
PNLSNVLRQTSYLTMVSMGQMIVLLTGGFDLSVGTTLAITSVVGALAMAGASIAMPDAVWLAISLGVQDRVFDSDLCEASTSTPVGRSPTTTTTRTRFRPGAFSPRRRNRRARPRFAGRSAPWRGGGCCGSYCAGSYSLPWPWSLSVK